MTASVPSTLAEVLAAPPAGLAIVVERQAGPRAEVEAATRWLVALNAAGRPWSDMALVVPGKRKWREPVVATFDALALPHRLLIGHPGAVPDFGDALLHAMSLYTAASMSRPYVAIVGLGDLPWKQQPLDEADAAVAAVIRNATVEVRLSWSKESALTPRLAPR